MKVLAATLLLSLATSALAETTLESLQRRCAEQERQIARLETENRQLREQVEQAAPAARTAEPEAPAASSAGYTVKSGDSLARIASQHGTTAEVLAKLNDIRNPALIRPGQKLRLPAAPSAPSAEAAAPTPTAASHVVRAGDTFYSISRQYGIGIADLERANPKVDPTALRVGQRISLESVRPAPRPSTAPAEPLREEAPEERQAMARQDDAGSSSQTVAHRPAPRTRTVRIEEEISFGDFARRHGMTPAKLNALNGLDLDSPIILAEGSELYVSAQPNSLP